MPRARNRPAIFLKRSHSASLPPPSNSTQRGEIGEFVSRAENTTKPLEYLRERARVHRPAAG